MIYYKQGNLFNYYQDYDIIAHGVNCQGVMGSGFAKQIKERFPWAYESYLEACAQRDPEWNLGRVRTVRQGSGIRIAHCFTQLNYGKEKKRYVSYDAIADVMYALNNLLISDEVILKRPCKLVMPMIGAGLGGGNWEVIKAIIETSFDPTTNVTVITT